MADYVPRGIFSGLTQSELDALRVIALDQISTGRFTNLSGAMKSSTREYPMSPQDMLEEIKFAEAINTGNPRPTRIYSDLRSQP